MRDGQTDMTNLVVSFRNFASVPKVNSAVHKLDCSKFFIKCLELICYVGIFIRKNVFCVCASIMVCNLRQRVRSIIIIIIIIIVSFIARYLHLYSRDKLCP
jgi:hypothetical protein